MKMILTINYNCYGEGCIKTLRSITKRLFEFTLICVRCIILSSSILYGSKGACTTGRLLCACTMASRVRDDPKPSNMFWNVLHSRTESPNVLHCKRAVCGPIGRVKVISPFKIFKKFSKFQKIDKIAHWAQM